MGRLRETFGVLRHTAMTRLVGKLRLEKRCRHGKGGCSVVNLCDRGENLMQFLQWGGILLLEKPHFSK
jgi:hypothetical protein